MSNNKTLIVGGSGFIGQGLCADKKFSEALHIGRSKKENQKLFTFKKLEVGEDFTDILRNVDVIIYAAGVAHSHGTMSESEKNNLSRINELFPVYLAGQAARNGVRRFIFLSSVKVMGERSQRGRSLTVNDGYHPNDFYAASKVAAEKALLNLAKTQSIEIIILRLPLVIGAEAKGNLRSIIKLAKLGIPMPFLAIKNKRSIISLDNLVQFISRLTFEEKKSKNILILKDQDDLSTAEIIRKYCELENINIRLFWFPSIILKIMFKIIRRPDLIDKLLNSFQIKLSKIE